MVYLRLSWSGSRWELECSRFESGAVRTAGFHFDGKIYWTGLMEVAEKYRQYADSRAEEKFKAADKQVNLSHSMNSSMSIPCPKGEAYDGFQKAGVEYILPRKDTLLGDEMGTGKTVIVMGVINADPSIKNILIICKNSHIYVWKRHLETWLVRNLTGAFALSGPNGAYLLPDTNIVIMNYHMAKKFRPEIDKRNWDLLVCDEIQQCKNPGSIRSRYVMGGEGIEPIKARRRVYVTGTPIMNRPIELWPLVKVCDPQGLGYRLDIFGKRYCAGEVIGGDMDYSGASNLAELNQKLRSTFMIRRLKKDVMPELPPKRRQIIPLPNPGISVVKEELAFYTQNEAIIEAAKANAELFQMKGDPASYKTAVKQLRSAQQIKFEQIAQLRYKTAIAKIPYAISYIEEVLEEQDKVIVFARHTDVVDAIVEKFKDKAVWMHGGISVLKRQAAEDSFQNDPKIKLIVGTFETMGEGWTLTAASYVLCVELEWVPSTITQGEDRAHRRGQKKSILIQHLVFNNSLDCNMAKKIIAKQEVIDKAVNQPDSANALVYYNGGST